MREAYVSTSNRYKLRLENPFQSEIKSEKIVLVRLPQQYVDGIERVLSRPGGRSLLQFLRIINARRQLRDYWFHVYKPGKGDIIVDVGAGNGLQVPLMSKLIGNSGVLLAIEAQPRTFKLLLEHCNRRALKNVKCLNVAVADKSGTVFIQDQVHHEANRISRDSNDDEFSLKVRAEPLDKICEGHNLGKIDFLKMNIEGAEQHAITGMKDIILRTRYVCIACHDFLVNHGEKPENVCTRKMVIEFLRSNNFDVVLRGDHPYPWVNDHVHAINRRDLSLT